MLRNFSLIDPRLLERRCFSVTLCRWESGGLCGLFTVSCAGFTQWLLDPCAHLQGNLFLHWDGQYKCFFIASTPLSVLKYWQVKHCCCLQQGCKARVELLVGWSRTEGVWARWWHTLCPSSCGAIALPSEAGPAVTLLQVSAGQKGNVQPALDTPVCWSRRERGVFSFLHVMALPRAQRGVSNNVFLSWEAVAVTRDSWGTT